MRKSKELCRDSAAHANINKVGHSCIYFDQLNAHKQRHSNVKSVLLEIVHVFQSLSILPNTTHL